MKPFKLLMFIFLFYSLNAYCLDFSVVPGVHVGPITKETTEADLIKIYGMENIERTSIDLGEGETMEGTVLFPNTNKALYIEWEANFKHPVSLTIYSKESIWKLKSDIKVGTPIEDVEKINGRVFKITGFGWDYEGQSMSWEQGNLSENLRLIFDPTETVTTEELMHASGSDERNSNIPAFRKMKLIVREINISL